MGMKSTLKNIPDIVTDHRRSRRQKPNPEYRMATCLISDDDYFVFGKKYLIRLLPTGRIAVKDENGETVICDKKDFAA